MLGRRRAGRLCGPPSGTVSGGAAPSTALPARRRAARGGIAGWSWASTVSVGRAGPARLGAQPHRAQPHGAQPHRARRARGWRAGAPAAVHAADRSVALPATPRPRSIPCPIPQSYSSSLYLTPQFSCEAVAVQAHRRLLARRPLCTRTCQSQVLHSCVLNGTIAAGPGEHVRRAHNHPRCCAEGGSSSRGTPPVSWFDCRSPPGLEADARVLTRGAARRGVRTPRSSQV